MRKIEKAPNWFKSKIIVEAVNELTTNKDFKAAVSKINDEYLYWDKVKYQQNFGINNHVVLWAGVKQARSFQSQSVKFGTYRFTYNLTSFIQKSSMNLTYILEVI